MCKGGNWLFDNEQNQSKAISFNDLEKSFTMSESSKIKSLHKVVKTNKWLLGYFLPFYFPKRGISMFCSIGVFKIVNINELCVKYFGCLLLVWFCFKFEMCCCNNLML